MAGPQLQEVISKIDWGLVIGLIALFFTAITLQVQRKHNRLSVKPIPNVISNDYEDVLVVGLENKGIGPLIIKDLSFTNQSGERQKDIISFFNLGFEGVVWTTFAANMDGLAVVPNGTETLIQLNGELADGEFGVIRDKVRAVLADIKVVLIYQDIYGNNMPKMIRSLGFFGRQKVTRKVKSLPKQPSPE